MIIGQGAGAGGGSGAEHNRRGEGHLPKKRRTFATKKSFICWAARKEGAVLDEDTVNLSW